MNLRKLKTLLWTLCFVALLGAGYSFYDIYRGKQDQRYTARSANTFHDLLKSGVDKVELMTNAEVHYTPERYEALWLARIDGSLPPKPVELDADKSKAELAFVLPPIDSIIKVGMILYSDDSLDRFVSLSYKNPGGQLGQLGKVMRLHISEGQTLTSPYDVAPYFGKLLSVTQQTATFQWGKIEVVVTPGLAFGGDQGPISDWTISAVDDPTSALDGVPEETIELGPGTWLIGEIDKLYMQEHGAEMLQKDLNLRTIPPKKEGERSMLELTHVEPGSLPARLGFASGDRIVSVNGIPMVSQVAAVNWYRAYPNEHAYYVIYQRRGAMKTITIYHK